MNKYFSLALIASLASLPIFADVNTPEEEAVTTEQTEEFMSDERLEEGFLTHYVNNAIASGMSSSTASADEKPTYGRTVTKWASAPKFGGYVIGSYKYNDEDGKHGGDGFNVRLVRAYVDGTIFNDFAYRLQVQFSGTPHVKDFYVEWQKYKEFKVKIGQFKRAFTFEDPYNPWDVGVGDYAQLTKYLSGMGDYCGEPSTPGGRDQGIQVQGDLFPIGKDQHRLLHYQVMLANGQGINCTDANGNKDIMGTLQFQPIKNLFIGMFLWKGKYTSNNVTVGRNRWAVGAKYETSGWSARAEYAHNTGLRLSDYVGKDAQGNEIWNGTGRADAWYATVGIPCTPWLKTYLKYDAYRNQGNNASLKSIYSICPNFQIHKNLMLQVQYNYVNDKTAKDSHHNEIWAETYFRF